MKKPGFFYFSCIRFDCFSHGRTKVTLPAIFSDNMVLQQKHTGECVGKAALGEK